MGLVNRYYNRHGLRRCRRQSVRSYAGRLPGRNRRIGKMRIFLMSAVMVELLWMGGGADRLLGQMKDSIRIDRIEEAHLSGEPYRMEASGMKEDVKEGIRILLEEKAVSLFRIKERQGRVE